MIDKELEFISDKLFHIRMEVMQLKDEIIELENLIDDGY